MRGAAETAARPACGPRTPVVAPVSIAAALSSRLVQGSASEEETKRKPYPADDVLQVPGVLLPVLVRNGADLVVVPRAQDAAHLHLVRAHLHSLPSSHLLLAARGILNVTQHKQEGQAMYLHGIHMADYQTEIFGEV